MKKLTLFTHSFFVVILFMIAVIGGCSKKETAITKDGVENQQYQINAISKYSYQNEKKVPF